MNAKHTPGPWECPQDSAFGGESHTVIINSRKGRPVADINTGTTTAIHNARLIAAAPELLAALSFALFTIEHREGLNHRMDLFTADERSTLRAAIRKATETEEGK